MKKCFFIGLTTFLLLFSKTTIFAQEQVISVKMSNQQIKIGEIFSITITIQNSDEWQTSEFPDITGFLKAGKSVSHSSMVRNGRRVPQHLIKQNYLPRTGGDFVLKKAEITVNKRVYILDETPIHVQGNKDELPIKNEKVVSEPQSKEDVLLFLLVDKKTAYLGEAIYTNLALYVSESNTINWSFPADIGQQIDKIAALLKQTDCLLNRRQIGEIKSEIATIRNKKYIKYVLYEATYYPLNEDDIVFPSVSLKINRTDKSKVDSASSNIVSFRSLPFKVELITLPEHPLKNKVPVGVFQMQDLNRTYKTETGKILNFGVRISGKGNFSTLKMETPANDNNFDFYPPSVNMQSNGFEVGIKTFSFKIFPKDSGSFNLGNYIKFIFFNTTDQQYDTLQINHTLNVVGNKIETSSANSGDIYSEIEKLDISEKEIDYRRILKITANVILILMLVGMLFIFDFRFKSKT